MITLSDSQTVKEQELNTVTARDVYVTTITATTQLFINHKFICEANETLQTGISVTSVRVLLKLSK